MILNLLSHKNQILMVIQIKDGKVVITTEIDYDKLDFEKYKGRVHLSGSDTLENERKLETVEYHLKDAGATEKK